MDPAPLPVPGLEVWLDGDCRLCSASARWCAARDVRRRLRFVDLHDPDPSLEPPADRESLSRELHVRRAGGSVVTGYDAWRAILAELPGWRWIAAIAGSPAAVRLGRALYRAVAPRRYLLSGNPGRQSSTATGSPSEPSSASGAT
jgi:predicted DCC family thiol-disulfide oxidoreductase YuxK